MQIQGRRFFLTFCFVDTVSLITGFIARYVGLLFGNAGGVLSIAVMLLCFALIYKMGKPYFEKYWESLDFIDTGWKRLTFSMAFIYITLIFVAAYPRPLIERPEYLPPYLVICIMVLSFYTVFFTNIAITRKVYEQSMRLKEQQKWFKMAYIDALTEIPNRMSYIEKIHQLERMEDPAVPIAIVIMDLDHFKAINDTLGHDVGDEVLKWAAKWLSGCFSDGNGAVYRIGGDEFAAITVGITEDELLKKLETLRMVQDGDVPYSVSSSYSFVDRSEKNAVNQAFLRAGAMMYASKTQKMPFGGSK